MSWPASATVTIADCSWLSGRWVGQDGDGQVDEQWLVPSGASMLGCSRIVSGGRTVHREFLLIEEREGGLDLTLILANDPLKTLHFHALATDGDSVIFLRDGSLERLVFHKLSGGLEILVNKVPPAESLRFVLKRP